MWMIMYFCTTLLWIHTLRTVDKQRELRIMVEKRLTSREIHLGRSPDSTMLRGCLGDSTTFLARRAHDESRFTCGDSGWRVRSRVYKWRRKSFAVVYIYSTLLSI